MSDGFPIDIKQFKKLSLDPANAQLTEEQRSTLLTNIQLLRDIIVLFTATGAARGVSGHTGGAYDTVPEVCILLSLFENSDKFYPVVFDEAGHRVATQYLLAALDGSIPPESLLHYREANSKLPGHPELGLTPGVKFSSGRLGHMWPMVNGVSLANRDKTVFCLGSDGSQQEGNDAEAARLAVAQNLNVKLIIDDNDVTIAGHPSDYLKGYDLTKTLEGHGLKVVTVQGEDIDALWGGIRSVVLHNGPAAVICKRRMAPGIPDIEGSPHGHDVIPVNSAIKYLQARGYSEKFDIETLYQNAKGVAQPYQYIGSTKDRGANRVVFGEATNQVLDKIGKEEAARKVMVIDSDLEGSTGLKAIHKEHPEVFIPSGIMERGNFSAAAGFGFAPDKFGVFSTFSAFLEMVLSEITMARLNHCNVLCHFSHSGVDEADNTCHFGINTLFADNGLADTQSYLYFPADASQMVAVVKRVFFDPGVRFIFSTRSKVPFILKEDGQTRLFGSDYEFVPGKDEIIAKGTAGYVVSFGEMLYRSWDAVLRLRREGLDVGLVNKPTLNVVDEGVIREIGQTKFVLVVESLNQKTGLGSKYGTWLLERNLTPKYGYMGTVKEGCGGLWEQIPYQGLDPKSIAAKIKQLAQ
ncbi:hypothetical protein AX15_006694 [Amanita polypyramis BW_CC]|nr:hypothetical protein AX15_006694 [Amanita polypyramis BW_CC]